MLTTSAPIVDRNFINSERRSLIQACFSGPCRGIRFAFASRMVQAKRFVYVLKRADPPPQYYVGLTSDFDARLDAHNNGACPHTSSRRPWHRHVVIEFSDETRAIRFERYLKSGSGRAFAKRHFD